METLPLMLDHSMRPPLTATLLQPSSATSAASVATTVAASVGLAKQSNWIYGIRHTALKRWFLQQLYCRGFNPFRMLHVFVHMYICLNERIGHLLLKVV